MRGLMSKGDCDCGRKILGGGGRDWVLVVGRRLENAGGMRGKRRWMILK